MRRLLSEALHQDLFQATQSAFRHGGMDANVPVVAEAVRRRNSARTSRWRISNRKSC